MNSSAFVVMTTITLGGCLLKPDRPATGTADAAPTGFVPRLIAEAYFAKDSAIGSTGMTEAGFAISTEGVHDGDLLLFVANTDTGGPDVWPLPTPGFQQTTREINMFETTYTAAWKFADREPAIYSGMYGPGRTDGNSTIALIAIAGADPTRAPKIVEDHGASAASPVVATAPSQTTTIPGSILLWAGGADWQLTGFDYAATFTPPPGYATFPGDLPSGFGDHGNTHFDRSTLSLAYAIQSTAGSTGSVTGEIAATNTGIPWAMSIAIAPTPTP